MADEEDIPPLDDMSDLLRQVEALKEKKTNGPSSPATVPDTRTAEKPASPVSSASLNAGTNSKDSLPSHEAAKPVKQASNQSKNAGFCGMKKGFLFGSNSSSSSSKTARKSNAPAASVGVEEKKVSSVAEDIPYIKPKNPAAKETQYQMPEVHQALDSGQNLLQNKEWVTEDLLNNVQKNETMMKRLADPSFMQALMEFQSNPQSAMAKYQNNAEMQEFLNDFCGMMGDHFTSLGDKQESAGGTSKIPPPGGSTVQTHSPGGAADLTVASSTDPHQPTAEDERRMQAILNDPEVKDILLDPRIQKLIETLRTDPEKAQRALQSRDPEVAIKIKKLVDVGLLQFQR